MLVELGRYDDALAEFGRLPNDNLFRLVGESILYAREKNRTASDATLLQARQVYGEAANYQFAQVHSQRGKIDRAFADLGRAWAARDPGLELVRSDPYLKPLRSDPRYAALVGRMNFPA